MNVHKQDICMLMLCLRNKGYTKLFKKSPEGTWHIPSTTSLLIEKNPIYFSDCKCTQEN